MLVGAPGAGGYTKSIYRMSLIGFACVGFSFVILGSKYIFTELSVIRHRSDDAWFQFDPERKFLLLDFPRWKHYSYIGFTNLKNMAYMYVNDIYMTLTIVFCLSNPKEVYLLVVMFGIFLFNLLMKFKKQFNTLAMEENAMRIFSLLIKALVNTLKKHPRFNSSVNEVADTLVLKHYYHVGIAVDTDAGLLVPVLRDADKKSLLEIAKDLAAIAEKARDRKVSPDDMKGGTFTISNQGAIGSGHFTPIINKPEVAILGIGKTALKPVVVGKGAIEARPLMPITISYDHRIIDGGAAARFTVDLVKALQEFSEGDVKL